MSKTDSGGFPDRNSGKKVKVPHQFGDHAQTITSSKKKKDRFTHT